MPVPYLCFWSDLDKIEKMIFPFSPGKQERIFYLFLVKLGLLFFISVMMIGDLSRIPDSTEKSEKSGFFWITFEDQVSRIKECFAFKTRLKKIEGQIRRGDTFINALTREGLEYSTAFKLFQEIRGVYDLKNIFPGQTYSLYLYQGNLKKIEFEISYNRSLSITKNAGGHFSAEIIDIPIRIRREVVKGTIKDSLFVTILSRGEKPELADMLASLYEYDIDFNRDIRDGDCFSIMVEKKYLNRDFIKYGHILGAKFTNQGKTIDVVRYTDPEGKTAYYHPDGRAVKKMFLRCPLPFMRVTSRYGLRRHPVLGFSARHNGVDFAAPGGTTVRATASGLVLKSGYDRVRGRYILVRHPNRYVSHYYHLSRIKSGTRPGTRVDQGQVIGFVGRSGRATGFHLHYGLQKNGRFLNPLLLKSPTKNPLKKVFLEDFKLHTARIFFMVSNSKIIKMSLRLRDVLLGYGDRGITEF